MLVCGTVATASAPWVLAQEVARAKGDSGRRQAAVAFCAAANLAQGLIAAALTAAVASRYADGRVVGVVTGSAMVIFAAATAVGYLQGLTRFRLIAALRVAEVVVKIGGGRRLRERAPTDCTFKAPT